MTVEERIRRLFEVWNSYDPDRLAECYDPEYEGVDVAVPELIRGPEGARAWVAPYWEAFPDLRFDLLETVVQGRAEGAEQTDRAAMHWTARGTHRGPLLGLPGTGRVAVFRGMTFLEFRGDRVLRGTYVWDLAAVLRAVGVLPG